LVFIKLSVDIFRYTSAIFFKASRISQPLKETVKNLFRVKKGFKMLISDLKVNYLLVITIKNTETFLKSNAKNYIPKLLSLGA